MSKRRLSVNSANPPIKRAIPLISTPVNFGLTLYDELVLNIFSHLTSYHDLCAVQQTNSYWARLSLDSQLWRALYVREFGRSRLRGSKGFLASVTRSDGREVRPLPGRAQTHSEVVKDWKWMFRISSNWRQGRCVSEELTWHVSDDPDLPIHMALAGGFVITASSSPSPSPQVFLHKPQHPPSSIATPSVSFGLTTKVTALALDQSQLSGDECRLAVFYSTGHICLFSASPSNPKESIERLSYLPATRRLRTTPIVQAVYHHPLLITLSSTFDLILYEVPSHSNAAIHFRQILTSFTSYPPTSLILSNPSFGKYKLVLAYSVPTYPSHWTVAITELAISSFTVHSSHTSSAFDLTPGWTPLTPTLSETLRDQYSRKVSEVSCISSDGRYVALAGSGTNTIQLYRLVSRALGPKLTFLRTLFGHVSPVQALCVADGRCVSLSRDGCLWVWDLERGGVEVDSEGLKDLPETAKIAFDERRILIILNGRIIARRFDM